MSLLKAQFAVKLLSKVPVRAAKYPQTGNKSLERNKKT
jgi:hypothetical protein